jgi:hypothetical protein
VKVDAANVKPNTSEKDKANPEMEHMPWTKEECTKVMLQTSDYIKLVSFVNSRLHFYFFKKD